MDNLFFSDSFACLLVVCQLRYTFPCSATTLNLMTLMTLHSVYFISCISHAQRLLNTFLGLW